MTKLHIGSISDNIFVPEEGQRDLMCSNKESLRCPSLCLRGSLNKETIESLEELGRILRNIHKRMVSEGYQLIDGVICKSLH